MTHEEKSNRIERENYPEPPVDWLLISDLLRELRTMRAEMRKEKLALWYDTHLNDGMGVVTRPGNGSLRLPWGYNLMQGRSLRFDAS